MNKNLRPYCISLDWLQLHLHRHNSFSASAQGVVSLFIEDPEDWAFRDAGHGSKTYKTILKISYKDEPFGELSLYPHSAQIHELSCTLKIDNKQLYMPNIMNTIAVFLDTFGFTYMGITRLDLAYDCNEFYGGLTAEHLMRKYEKGEIIKYGASSGYRQFKQGYNCTWDAANRTMSLMSDVVIAPQFDASGAPSGAYAEELERQKVYSDKSTLISLPDERNPLKCAHTLQNGASPIIYTSTTWGSRSSGHQVQLYNKTLEMQQVKYKHHIAQRWLAYGLNLKKDVWRLEIRISKSSRLLENLTNGHRRLLDPRDLVLEEQLEQLFWDYAWKYFRFLRLDPRDKRASKAEKLRPLDAILAHKDRLQVYPILCLAHRNAKGELTEPLTQKYMPRVPVPQKDYSRSVKIAMNVVEGAMQSMARAKNPDLVHLQETYRELSAVYGLNKRKISENRTFEALHNLDRAEYPIFDFYTKEWPELETKWFKEKEKTRSVIAWQRIIGHAKTKVQAELLSFGYSVPLQFVDEAMEMLLDEGHIAEHLQCSTADDLLTDTPICYSSDGVDGDLPWSNIDNLTPPPESC